MDETIIICSLERRCITTITQAWLEQLQRGRNVGDRLKHEKNFVGHRHAIDLQSYVLSKLWKTQQEHQACVRSENVVPFYVTASFSTSR